jgi:hypothetical protein
MIMNKVVIRRLLLFQVTHLHLVSLQPSGFNVGGTVKACTKGIWLWGKAVSVEGSDMHVLFMDTEVRVCSGANCSSRGVSFIIFASRGSACWRALTIECSQQGLGSTVRSETYDARIFALALLLSSYFIYNSVGTIGVHELLAASNDKTVHGLVFQMATRSQSFH